MHFFMHCLRFEFIAYLQDWAGWTCQITRWPGWPLYLPYLTWSTWTYPGITTLYHRRRIYTEEKAKVVGAVWGTEFIIYSLQHQLFCTTVIGRIGLIHPLLYIILVYTSFSSYHPGTNSSFPQIILVQFILFFISSWCKIASAARNLISFAPQTAATTFAFSSVSILLLWEHLSCNISPLHRPKFGPLHSLRFFHGRRLLCIMSYHSRCGARIDWSLFLL